MDFARFHSIVQRLVAETGPIARRYFRSADLGTEAKDDCSPVTRADLEIERLIRERLEEWCPGQPVLGEEEGTTAGSDTWSWVVDPIDGTRSFVGGCPLFGTLLGVLEAGRPRFGAIYLPVQDLLCAGDGQHCLANGRPTKVRSSPPLGEAILLTTDHLLVQRYREWDPFWKLAQSVGLCRTWGDCYAYAQLVTGFADVVLDPIMNPWDLLPLIPVVEGAGGVITGWEGGPAAKADSVVAATPELHAQILSALSPPASQSK